MEKLIQLIPIDYTIYWFILLMILLFKVLPTVYRYFDYSRRKINSFEEFQWNLEQNTRDIKSIKEQLNHDYARISDLERHTSFQQEYINDSLQERELILKSLMHISQGLQELGANGPTKQAEKDIQDFLIHRTHKKTQEIKFE